MVNTMQNIIGRKTTSCGEQWVYFFKEGTGLVAWLREEYVINFDELPDGFIVDKVYGKTLVDPQNYYTPTFFNLHGNVKLEHVFIQLREKP